MENTHVSSSSNEPDRPFSPLLFLITIGLWMLAYLLLIRYFFPQSIRPTSGPWWLILIFVVFLPSHVLNAFIEYFFHRYMLHQPFLPGMRKLWVQHDIIHHKKHTLIAGKPVEGKPDFRKVSNNYPIVRPEQHEASYFPWFTCGGFLLFASLWLVPLQLMFRTAPIMLGGSLAIAFSLILYEFVHATLHRPNEWWRSKLFESRFQRFWRWFYADHLRHHADDKCCLGISKVFGLWPLPDQVFGTWANRGELYIHGSEIEIQHFESPTPGKFIQWLDDFVARNIQQRRSTAST